MASRSPLANLDATPKNLENSGKTHAGSSNNQTMAKVKGQRSTLW